MRFLLLTPEKEGIADLVLRHADRKDDNFVIDRLSMVYPSGFKLREVSCNTCCSVAVLVAPKSQQIPMALECMDCGEMSTKEVKSV